MPIPRSRPARALLLFASIQISMILYGLIIGERLSFLQSIGVAFAVSGWSC